MKNRAEPKYATRLNSFRKALGKSAKTEDLLRFASQVDGLNSADLNYPDHLEGYTAPEMTGILGDCEMTLNGLAMRYYTDPAFSLGAFTHPDQAVRQAAVDLTRRGLDALSDMQGSSMTLWMGQDGVDYSFQGDYSRMWDHTVAALHAVCAHNPDLDIAIEYKPNEPRSYALMPDMATTLLAIKEVGAANLGVTLDFAHVLYADEIPAHAAVLANRHSRLIGVHLNDGYGKRDDGLMVGSVHPIQTVELFVMLHRINYDGVIYFDTFPDQGGLDPLEEARTNVVVVERLRQIAESLVENTDLEAAIDTQDATASLRIISNALYGSG